MKDIGDPSLAEQLQHGDKEVFRILADRWHPKIHRFAYGIFGNTADAAEISQKTLIKVYQNIQSLEKPAGFSSWIYRIAHNLCLDEMKRAGRRKTEPLGLFESDQQVDGFTPAHELESKELHEMIRNALAELPDQQRVVVVMKEMEGLKFREIAEILDIPENTAKTRMYTGLKSLGSIMKRWNIQTEYLNYD